MRNLIFSLLFTLSAFGQLSTQKITVHIIDTFDKYIGVYEYVYPYNTDDLIENHFIVLSKVDNKLTGYYYGTSDEFDLAREGYIPAFFVSKMDNLKIKGDTITFKLNVENADFLTKAVDLKYKSTKEAIHAGYKNWKNKITTNPKYYQGLLKNYKMIVFKGDQQSLYKTFNKRTTTR